jgi:hypothetical protein
MSISESINSSNFSLEKKATTTSTEDLHIVPPSTAKAENKKLTENIAQGQVTSITSKLDAAVISTPNSATSIKSTTTSKTSKSTKPQKTIAEITQELKANLNNAITEIERADVEFERLFGNLEKKIESLRINLGSSKLE